MAPTLATLLLRGGSEGPGRVLLAVAEQSGGAAELAERTGVDRSTVGAHLATLEARSLVARRGSSYVATPADASLAGRLDVVLAAVAAPTLARRDTVGPRSPSDRGRDDTRRPG